MRSLREKVFAGWPREVAPLGLKQVGVAENEGVTMRAWDFTSQKPFTLRLWMAHRSGITPEQLEMVVLHALDQPRWEEFRRMAAHRFPSLFEGGDRQGADGAGFDREKARYSSHPWAMAYVAPRGVGPTAWNGDDKSQTQMLRRFYLLGQTLEGMQVWDLRRAIAALRATAFAKPALWLQGEAAMGVNALYASLFEPGIARIDLHQPPPSHEKAPTYLNVLKYLDVPEAAAMAATTSELRIETGEKEPWKFPSETVAKLGRASSVQLIDAQPTK